MSSWPWNSAEISAPEMSSMPARAASSRASGSPCSVSWSVRAKASMPALAILRTSSVGESRPSEHEEWLWRSTRTGGIYSPPVDRQQVARVLEEVAEMLELAGENPFKVKAYENGARAVLAYPGDLDEAIASGSLRKVPGIGSGLSAAIQTLATTGSLPLHEELLREFPPG